MAAPNLREQNKAANRAAVTAAAERLFLKHGFDEVTLDQVAADCGMSVRTVLRYFPTKEALALARTADSIDDLRARLAEGGADVLEVWRAFNLQQADELGARRGLRQYLAMVHGHPALRGQLHALMVDLEDHLARALRGQTGDDGLTPTLLSALLVGGNLAVRREWLSSSRPFDPGAFLAVIDYAADLFRDRLSGGLGSDSSVA
jgi:AcrR family transcriptional regulator